MIIHPPRQSADRRPIEFWTPWGPVPKFGSRKRKAVPALAVVSPAPQLSPPSGKPRRG